MFISSYTTYVQSNVDNNTSKQKIPKGEKASQVFSTNFSKNEIPKDLSTIPLDYISKKQSSSVKQELEFQKQQLNNPLDKKQEIALKAVNKFTVNNQLSQINSLYTNNVKLFSQLRIPHTSINKTPNIDQTLPKEPREIKELNMRHKMINTYLDNESYYKITA